MKESALEQNREKGVFAWKPRHLTNEGLMPRELPSDERVVILSAPPSQFPGRGAG